VVVAGAARRRALDEGVADVAVEVAQSARADHVRDPVARGAHDLVRLAEPLQLVERFPRSVLVGDVAERLRPALVAA
jgi:hypothetical protein